MRHLFTGPGRRSAYLLAIVVLMSGSLAFAAGVPQRSEIDPKYKWDLTKMFATDQAWEEAFQFVKANLGRLTEFQGKLSESAANLRHCLMLRDSINMVNDNVYVYSGLKLDEDNRDSKYQELQERASMLNSELNNAQSFIEPELLSIDAAALNALVDSDPQLAVYRFYLNDLQRSKAHILSKTEEGLLAMAGPVMGAPSRIFNQLENADVTFGTIKDEKGEEIQLTRERYSRLLESPDRRVRRDANYEYNSTFLKYVNTMAATLASSVRKDYFMMQARKYPTCLDMALDDDNIPTDVFHKLLEAARGNLAPLHKWLAIKKRVLKLDTVKPYDLWVPVTADFNKEYSYEEGKKIVLEGLRPLGKEYVKALGTGFESGWVDVYETQGKGSGAYHWGTYTSPSYVLMNYNNTMDAVFTLGHEMGHAMHSYYTKKSEPYFYSGHYIFTAEVASTCNEAIMMKYLLERTKDKNEKIALLYHYINQVIGTFYTQVMFSEFELAIHDRLEKHEALSTDFMRKTYRDIYQRYWGPELVIDSINDQGGLRISHFYRQYYVFQYATCYAAAQELSQRILRGDKGALDAYFKFLGTGSSKYPVDILKDAGVDMTTPQPVANTIKLFGELVDQMDKLLSES